MANQLAANPWKLDTVSATPFYATNVRIANVVFTDYTADTDSFQLKDRYGNVVLEGNGSDDLQPVTFFKLGWVYGLALTALSNAASCVYIYFE